MSKVIKSSTNIDRSRTSLDKLRKTNAHCEKLFNLKAIKVSKMTSEASTND